MVIVNNILVDGTTCSGDVVIPDGVLKICHYAFYNCSKITSVAIPDSVTEMGAFAGCSLLESANIPSSVTELDAGVFSGCKSLKNIVIPFCRGFKAIKKSARMPMYIILSGSISRLAPLHLLKTYYGW